MATNELSAACSTIFLTPRWEKALLVCLQRPLPLPLHSSPFGCCSHPIFSVSHLLPHTIFLSVKIFFSELPFPTIICIFLSGSPLCAFPLSLSPSHTALTIFVCCSSLQHLINSYSPPPSFTPLFRSHTINAEKRAHTEVTCTEHIKEV